MILSAQPPFNFRSVVLSHGWYQLAPNVWDEAAEVLRRPMRLASGRVVSAEFFGHAQGLGVKVRGRLTAAERRELAAAAHWMFNLDAGFAPFYQLAAREPRLAQVEVLGQGRLLRSPTLFEDLIRILFTTNIQWSGTRRLTAALVARFGDPTDDGAQHAFPTPERLARTRESALRALGLGYRAPYVLALARAVVRGQLDLNALLDPGWETPALRRALLALPGIGPYAAAHLLIFLNRYEYIGVDTEAVAAVSQHFYAGRQVGAKEIEAAFAHWGEWKALAYWFWDWES
jgi:3-methyladenine DNA glycosylase/8-oxoguanine DNA glycosylase